MTNIVERLLSDANDHLDVANDCDCDPKTTVNYRHYQNNLEAADEIERLREKCNKQAEFLRRVDAERFPNTLFIHSLVGQKDQNGMPEKLLVVPAYGVDFSYIYEYTGKTTGAEW